MRVVMIGATGLVGSLLADRLLTDDIVSEVHALGRRTSGRNDPRWHEHVAPPGGWPDLVQAIGAQAAVSALGTTMRAAGSEAAFRAVDLDIVTAFARAAKDGGARRIVTVSSVGADSRSRNFYLALKGDMEHALTDLGFDRLDVLRPGLLRGQRGAERRLAERIGIKLSPLVDGLLRGPLARYASIDARIVADAAAVCLYRNEVGRFVHENAGLRRLASTA